jgi:hypothetical protein
VAERELARLLLEQERKRDPFARTGNGGGSANQTKKKTAKKKDTKKAEAQIEEVSSSKEGEEGEEEEGVPDDSGGDELSLALVLVADERADVAAGPTGRVWTEAYDGEGTAYYYSEEGETAWELPVGDSALPEGYSPEGLGGGGAEFTWEAEADGEWVEAGGGSGEEYGEEWEQVLDDQGGVYWYNTTTGESMYE